MKIVAWQTIFIVRAVKSSKKSQRREGKSRTHARVFSAPGPLPMPRELLTAGVELDADAEVERQRRMEALKAKLRALAAEGKIEDALDSVLSVVVELERENEQMAWRLLRALRYRFGRSTEKLSKDELKQLFLALGGNEAQTESQPELSVPAPPVPDETIDGDTNAINNTNTATDAEEPKKTRQRKTGGSTVIGPNVERSVTDTSVPADERLCALCGREKVTFGHVEHELIEFVPAKIVVHVERREKCTCPDCHKDVSVAPRTQAPAVVRRVAPSLLAKLLSDKCLMALPLDRQRREFGRLGVDFPDKTLASYWAYTTDLLEPVAVAHVSTVFGSQIVGADDSRLMTLDKSSKHGSFRGHLWCFVGTDGSVLGPELVGYGYTASWEADEITDWFAAIDGSIQCDGYAGYSKKTEDEDGQTRVAVPDERRLGCGMHIRSKFHAALSAKDRRAAIPLKHFADLYQIEAEAKQHRLDATARGRLRQERSLPILAALDEWVDSIHPKLLPQSPLRRATTYAINQRAFFRRCFEDGRFEIDNGRTERRIRNFAVGRRNYLFTGSERGGERLAVAYTLVDSCSLHNIDPRLYIQDVVMKIERGWPMSRLSDLTPVRWAAEHTEQKPPE